jgi:hypothetical protein
MLQPSSSSACRQPRRSAKPSRLACWSRWRWQPSSTLKPPLMVRRRGKRAGGGVTHALGVPGAPPLRKTRHHQGLDAAGAVPIGRDQAHRQRRERFGFFSVNTLSCVNAFNASYGHECVGAVRGALGAETWPPPAARPGAGALDGPLVHRGGQAAGRTRFCAGQFWVGRTAAGMPDPGRTRSQLASLVAARLRSRGRAPGAA